MTSVDFRSPVSVSCAGSKLRFEPDGRVTLSSQGVDDQSVVVGDLALSNFVELWCGTDRAYFVGLKGKSLWFVQPSVGLLTEALELARLDLTGHYDPGGLHRIEFRELPGGDLLIIHEFGAARVSSAGEPRWQQRHGDLTAHVDGVVEDVLWFSGEDGRFGVDLVDGRQVPGR